MKDPNQSEARLENATLLLDMEKETREFCERFGAVKKVVVHDNNPEGVVCVTFKDTESSDSAVKALNGRVVDGRKLEVTIWDGRTKYSVVETEEQRAARIEQWRKFISE